LELLVLPFSPDQDSHQEYGWYEKRVDGLQEFGEERGLDSLQPDGGINVPDAKVQVRQPLVGIGAPHRGNQQRHFLVTETYVRQRIPIPEEPACPIGNFTSKTSSAAPDRCTVKRPAALGIWFHQPRTRTEEKTT